MVAVFGKQLARMVFVVGKHFQQLLGIIVALAKQLKNFAETEINYKSVLFAAA